MPSNREISFDSELIKSYRYSFNGKESESTSMQGTYDFGARIYDGRLGRWWGVDSHSLLYSNQSVYSFVANSPFRFIDPDGNKISGSIGARFAILKLKIKTAKRLAEAARSKDYVGVQQFKDQLQDIQRIKNSEVTYHFAFSEESMPENRAKESGRFTISPNLNRNKSKGRIDITYRKECPEMSLACGIAAACLFESKAIELIPNSTQINESNHLFDFQDAFSIELSKALWNEKLISSGARIAEAFESLDKKYGNRLSQDVLDVSSKGPCSGLPGTGVNATDFNCTQEYSLEMSETPYVYINSNDEFSTKEKREKQEGNLGINPKEKE